MIQALLVRAVMHTRVCLGRRMTNLEGEYLHPVYPSETPYDMLQQSF